MTDKELKKLFKKIDKTYEEMDRVNKLDKDGEEEEVNNNEQ